MFVLDAVDMELAWKTVFYVLLEQNGMEFHNPTSYHHKHLWFR